MARPKSFACFEGRPIQGCKGGTSTWMYGPEKQYHLRKKAFWQMVIYYYDKASQAITVCLHNIAVVIEPTPAGTGEIFSTIGSTA